MRRSAVASIGLAVVIATSIGGTAALQQLNHRTKLFACGTDEQIPGALPVTAERIALAADGRLFAPCPPYPVPDGVTIAPHAITDREVREAAVILSAASSRDTILQQLAAQAMGRIALPSYVSQKDPQTGLGVAGPLSRLLGGSTGAVQMEAANAIGDALSGVRGDWGTPVPVATNEVRFGHDLLALQLLRPRDDAVAGVILETLGRLNYPDDATRDEVEKLIASHDEIASARILGVAKGLEALIRKNPRRPVGPEALARLRKMVADGITAPRVEFINGAGSQEAAGAARDLARSRRVAMTALQTARDEDVPTILRAAADDDWQVRRLAALRLNLTRTDMASAVQKLSVDPDFHVRYEMLALIGRQASETATCAPLLNYFRDAETTIVLRAIDLVPATCSDADLMVRSLSPAVDGLAESASYVNWHVPAHAFTALAKLDPASAKVRLADVARHPTWQVRALAVTTAGLLGDMSTALALAGDVVPNVRNAALEALVRAKSPAVFEAAIGALSSDDHQLIRTAATALRGAPESLHADIRQALVGALQRLTESGRDTSRDPRLAILERLRQVLTKETSGLLQPYVTDFDPQIRQSAARIIAMLRELPAPTYPNPQQRYPWQPEPDALIRLPSRAMINMADGQQIQIELLVKQAPVTIARFVELVRAGYYNGLTFHRVVPNFVIQGGSPGANEYMGADRYWRDELGLESNLRGSVGLSTRGRDTGDGQFYINLVDLPRLDHDYTIFARVIGGLDVVDRILEGATIQMITVR